MVVAPMVVMAGCSPPTCHGPQPWRHSCRGQQNCQAPAEVNVSCARLLLPSRQTRAGCRVPSPLHFTRRCEGTSAPSLSPSRAAKSNGKQLQVMTLGCCCPSEPPCSKGHCNPVPSAFPHLPALLYHPWVPPEPAFPKGIEMGEERGKEERQASVTPHRMEGLEGALVTHLGCTSGQRYQPHCVEPQRAPSH